MQTKQKQQKHHNKKKPKTTKPNDIATDTTTPTPEATAATVPGVAQPSGWKAEPDLVLQQGLRSVQLAAMYAVAFRLRNYTDSEVQELKDAASAFDAAYNSNQAAKRTSKERTAAYKAVVKTSLVFRDELVAVTRLATQGKPDPFENPSLRLTATRRATKLALWFRAMGAVVEANEAALTASLGQSAVAFLAAKTEALNAAISDRSVSQMALPLATEAQRAAQLRLVTAIAKQRLVAEAAFAGNRKVLREFVPLWSQKRRTARKTAQPQPGSGASSSAPAGSAPAGSSGSAGPSQATPASAPTEAPAAKAAAPADARPTT